MAIGIDALVWVKLVSNAQTPAEYLPLNGKELGVPPGFDVPSAGRFYDVAGFRQQGTAPVVWEWVMTGPVDPVAAAIDALPGGGGWKLPASRTVWLNNANALLAAGFDRTQIKTRMTSLFNAAVNEARAP